MRKIFTKDPKDPKNPKIIVVTSRQGWGKYVFTPYGAFLNFPQGGVLSWDNCFFGFLSPQIWSERAFFGLQAVGRVENGQK